MARRKVSGKPSRFKRRNLLIFIVCLMIATLFWFLLAFNGFYTTTIRVPVQYINMPEQKMMTDKLPTELEVSLSGSGYQLMSYMLQPDNALILLDGRNIGTSPSLKASSAFLTTYSGIDYFNRLHGDVSVLHISPDTLFFNFFERGIRKVPVIPNLDLSFRSQFYLSDSARVLPDSITLTGPADRFDSIFSIRTELLQLSDVYKSGVYTLKIEQLDSALSYAPVQVDVELNVDQFTEAVIEVPIRIEHLLSRDSLDIYPEKVQVSCLVALKQYNTLKPSSFVVAADAFDLRDTRSRSLKLYLRKYPAFIKQVRIQPETVEFIVRKK